MINPVYTRFQVACNGDGGCYCCRNVLTQVQCSDDPLKVKAQNILGQFEDAKSLVNTPSALGVILAPLTPAVVPKDQPPLASTTSRVDLPGRATAFKPVPSVQPEAGAKASEGNVCIDRYSLSAILLETEQKPVIAAEVLLTYAATRNRKV